jgi:hypothetical protein
MVRQGMSQQQVLGMVGHPIGKNVRADGMECLQHGMFSINEPSTTVYVLCYVGPAGGRAPRVQQPPLLRPLDADGRRLAQRLDVRRHCSDSR